MKFLSGAVAVAALLVCAGAAQAKTYHITDTGQVDGSLVPTDTYTITTKQAGKGPVTDYFDFTIDSDYYSSFTAAFINNKNSHIDAATLTLYSGNVTDAGVISGSPTPLGSTSGYDLGGLTGLTTLNIDSLAAGSYYIKADVTPKAGTFANYTVDVTLDNISAAPEPGVWVLMIAGVGLAGASFRRGRKYRLDGMAA